MRKNCFRLLSLTVLAVAVTSISAFAADAHIDANSSHDDVTLTANGTEKVDVAYNSAESGKEYLIMVQSGDSNATPTESNLVYIDQKTADGTAFIVYPKEMTDGTIYHVYLSSNANSGITTRQEVGTFTYSAGQSDYKLGDVDGNGKVNSSDAGRILQHTVGKVELSGTQLASADVNGDSKVNSSDAGRILLYVVGKVQSFS